MTALGEDKEDLALAQVVWNLEGSGFVPVAAVVPVLVRCLLAAVNAGTVEGVLGLVEAFVLVPAVELFLVPVVTFSGEADHRGQGAVVQVVDWSPHIGRGTWTEVDRIPEVPPVAAFVVVDTLAAGTLGPEGILGPEMVDKDSLVRVGQVEHHTQPRNNRFLFHCRLRTWS